MAKAIHPDPEINALYIKRRELAGKADGSGWGAGRAWQELERLEADLDRIAPDGDWRYEGRTYGGDWIVTR